MPLPSGVNLRTSPGGANKPLSATKRLPALPNASPRGKSRPIANGVPTPLEVNLRMVSLPAGMELCTDTNRIPKRSKANPTGPLKLPNAD